MKLLKSIGKFFGGFLVLFGLTIFIISYFGSYAVSNFSILEKDINEYTLKSISNQGGMSADQFKEYCSKNPNDENCGILNKNPIIEQIKKEINEFIYYGNAMRILGFIFFLAGLLLLVFFSGFMAGLKSVSIISLIGTIFSYLYYKYIIIGALSNFLPKEIFDVTSNWISITLKQTLNFVIILGIIFLILSIGLYILNKNRLTSEEKISQGSK